MQGIGSGLAIVDGTRLRMAGGRIRGNRSPLGVGGGVFLRSTDTQLDSVEIALNGTTNQGGGMFLAVRNTVVLNRTTFDGNAATGAPGMVGAGLGGAIMVTGFSQVSIANGLFVGNAATATGGAIEYVDTGSLTIADSRFVRNTSFQSGGAARFTGVGTGAVRVVIERSTFSSNSTDVGDGGAIANFIPLMIERSTFDRNSAGNSGGAIVTAQSQFTLRNSTLSGNSAQAGGGLAVGGLPAPILVANVTMVGNSASLGGAISLITIEPVVQLVNTILAGSQGANGSQNCRVSSMPQILSLGGNISDDPTCASLVASTDRNNVSAGVAPILAANGGPTLTHALLAGSPAINAGIPNLCPTNDQRGAARIGVCDSGAFEFGAIAPVQLQQTTRAGERVPLFRSAAHRINDSRQATQ